MDANYLPPPLSPRRLQLDCGGQTSKDQLQPPASEPQHHSRGSSGGSMSWLDTIDESGGSSASSVHSLEEGNLYRRHVRVPSGDTEAEFDAALDAAVEAAYADGLEPYEYDEQPLTYDQSELSEPVKVMVDTERKRLSDRAQVIQQAHNRTKELARSKETYRRSDDAEEEERILEEISKDFGFDFGLPAKSSMPRKSDSSEYSGSTYHSSMSSSRTTAMTSLSTVAEAKDTSLPVPKPNVNLPRLSEESSQRDSLALADGPFSGRLLSSQTGSVRSRRMSGQNTKQLKIETSLPPRNKIPPPAITAPPTTVRIDDSQLINPISAKSDTQIIPNTIFKQAPVTTPLQPPQSFFFQSSPQPGTSPSVTVITHSPVTPGPTQKEQVLNQLEDTEPIHVQS